MTVINLEEVESVEEIEKVYGRRIRTAEEDEQGDLKLELREKVAEWRELQASRRELSAVKREALVKYPLAAAFEKSIVGRTPEAIEAEAKAFHETVEASSKAAADKVREELAPGRAREQYGAPTAGGSGRPASNPQEDPNEALKQKVWSTLERGDAVSRVDAARFGSIRIAEAAITARQDPSYKAVDYQRTSKPNVDARGKRKGGAE